MATKKQDILVVVTANPVEEINVWIDIDRKTEAIADILSIEGVLGCRASIITGPLYVRVDPRYDDVEEVAAEIRELLAAEVPDVFKEE